MHEGASSAGKEEGLVWSIVMPGPLFLPERKLTCLFLCQPQPEQLQLTQSDIEV